MMYQCIAYDKDHDRTYCYGESENLEFLLSIAMALKPLIDCDELRTTETNEPIDWMEVVAKDNPNLIYWASYSLPFIPITRQELQAQ